MISLATSVLYNLRQQGFHTSRLFDPMSIGNLNSPSYEIKFSDSLFSRFLAATIARGCRLWWLFSVRSVPDLVYELIESFIKHYRATSHVHLLLVKLLITKERI